MPDRYGLFVLATSLLILTPGPNVALIVANSVAHGARYGLLTVAGTTAAVFVHMLFVGFGMGQAMGTLGAALGWIRWLGVAYLLYLGVQQWRAAPVDLAAIGAQRKSASLMLRQAVLVSLSNPKALLFYGAFFPQFIAPNRAIGPQLAVLCTTYLILAGGIDSLWALAAGRMRAALARHARARNRVSGALLMGAGAGLACARAK